MDLKTFLLARIEEDEERNNPDPDPSGSCDYLHGVHYDSTRVLAECAAKRAIVEHWGPYETLEGPDLMLTLAAVYADHTDYQPEWAQEAS